MGTAISAVLLAISSVARGVNVSASIASAHVVKDRIVHPDENAVGTRTGVGGADVEKDVTKPLPMERLFRWRRPEAGALGRYFRRRQASSTARRVASVTRGLRFSTRLTVMPETPASAATSAG